MVAEAKEYEQEDKLMKEKIDKRNNLESFCYNLKNTIDDEEKGLKDKLSAEDLEIIETAIQEVLDWMDENDEAESEEYDEKQVELENIVNPIMKNVYQQQDGGDADFEDSDDFEDDSDFDHDEL